MKPAGRRPGYYFVIIGPAGTLIARVVVFSGNRGWIPTESHPDSWIEKTVIKSLYVAESSCF